MKVRTNPSVSLALTYWLVRSPVRDRLCLFRTNPSVRYSLFLCEDGSVYASGSGENGVLGDGRTDEHFEGTPVPIDTANIGNKRVIQVSASNKEDGLHSLFLCEDGSVYSSGYGLDGVLGDGRTDNHSEGTPIPIDTANMEGKKETELTCHSVSQKETELTCHSVSQKETELTCHSVSQKEIQVSAGLAHSLFLT